MLRTLAVSILVLVITLNFTSAFLRHAKSGLMCPDRPLCYEQVGSSGEATVYRGEESVLFALATKAHRLLATVAGVLVLLLNTMIFRSHSLQPLRPVAVVMVGAVLWLSILGVAAGASLEAGVVLGNLAGGVLLLGATTVLVARLFGWELSPPRGGGGIFVGIALLLMLFLHGGLISSAFSGMSCNTLSGCNGAWWSDNPLVQMQLLHRLLAVVTLLYFLQLLHRLYWGGGQGQRILSLATLSLLIMQILLGVVITLQQLPLVATSLHSLSSQLLIALLAASLAISGSGASTAMENGDHG